MGLESRLRRAQRLQDEAGPQSCGSCPYERAPVNLEATRYVDREGNEVGFEPDPNEPDPPEICGKCPYTYVLTYAVEIVSPVVVDS